MKDMFPEYYYEPDFNKLWEQAIFVFDANVLLDIFRFSPKTSGELIEILEGLKSKDRIWMPYQFAYEYHKNLMPVQKAINGAKGKIKTAMQQHKKIKEELNRLSTRAGFKVNETHIEEIKEVEGVFEKILQDLSNFENEYKSKGDGDLLAEKIAQFFAGNVGEYNSDPRIENISSIGKQRFDRKIPPGFKDANKDKSDPFGDLIGWFQMIAHAKKESKPLILVSNDRDSDDWFLKQNGLKGPRPELRKEMRNEANVDLYLYTTKTFMEQAKNYLDSHVSKETIEEIENEEDVARIPEWLRFIAEQNASMMEEARRNMASVMEDVARIPEWSRFIAEQNASMMEEARRNMASVMEDVARIPEWSRFITEQNASMMEEARRNMASSLGFTAEEARRNLASFSRLTPGLSSQRSGLPTNDDEDDDSSIIDDNDDMVDDNGNDDST